MLLNGGASLDPDGTIVSYEWSWDGGSASGVTANGTFPLGATEVTLTVTDDDGDTDIDTLIVTVNISPNLVGGNGDTWSFGSGSSMNLQDASLINGGFSGVDAFDGASRVEIDGVAYSGGVVSQSPGLRTGETQNIGGVDVAVSFEVLPGRPAIRTLVTLTNPGGTPLTPTLGWLSNWGSDGSTILHYTSSGDASYSTTDFYGVTNDVADPAVNSGDPTNVSFWGDGNGVLPDSITATVFSAVGTEGLGLGYGMSLAPGETQTFLFVHELSNSGNAGLAAAQSALSTDELLAGLDPAFLAALQNWGGINQAPVANAGADITVGDSDANGSETVLLNGGASLDPDGTIVSYEWSWDGGSASGVTANGTFPLGATEVTLTVTDDDGDTDIDTLIVTVNISPNLVGTNGDTWSFGSSTGMNLGDASLNAGGFSGGDAFDGASRIEIDGVAYSGSVVSQSPSLRTGETQNIGGVDVAVSFEVLSGRPAIRTLVTLSNPGGTPLTPTLGWLSNWGSDGSTILHYTSSGDASYSTTDFYGVTNDVADPAVNSGDPTNVSFWGDGNGVLPDSITATVFSAVGTEGLGLGYGMSLAPGETQTFLFVHELSNSGNAGLAAAQSALSTDELLAGLDPAFLDALRNWGGSDTPGMILLIEDQVGFGTTADVLTANGFDVTVVNNEYANGYATLLDGAYLSQFAFIIYGERGAGSGSLLPANVRASLENYIQNGGNLLVTGYDTLGSPTDPELAALVRAVSPGDYASGNAVWTVSSTDHPILNGPFGDFRGQSFSATVYDSDVLTPDTAAGAVELVSLGNPRVTGKLIFTDLPGAGGSVGYWNGGISGTTNNAQPDFSDGATPQSVFLNYASFAAGSGGGGSSLDFRIVSMETTGAAVVDHNALTGDDRGGIAVSNSRVFVTGDTSTSSHARADLSGGFSLGTRYDGLCSDVGTGKVYTLAFNGTPLVMGFSNVQINQLIELDGSTGALTANVTSLSTIITVNSAYGSANGVFSGRGRVVIHNGTNVFDILIPSGTTTDLGPMAFPNMYPSESWARWGVAEYFNGALHLAYRSSSGPSFERARVPDGLTETIATFSNLSDLASWTVSPSTGRWYFHYESSGQFGGTSETLGYADATFSMGSGILPPEITSPLTASVTAGAPFNYTIEASNSPTGYGASGLPAGLSVDTGTGVISGSVAVPGLYPITISASNAAGTGDATLELTVNPTGGGGTVDSVLILGAPNESVWNDDVVAKLAATSAFSQVDVFNANSGTPTLAQLLSYDAVLVYSDGTNFSNPTLLGDRLADYADAGGGVVVATFATVNSLSLQGRIVTGGYLPYIAGSQSDGTSLTLVADIPGHPLLSGVSSFNGGSMSYHGIVTLAPGATQVAQWSNGQPLVMYSEPAGASPVVALNFFPPSSDARSDFWDASTDGAALMKNALQFSGGNSFSGVVALFSNPSYVDDSGELPNTSTSLTNLGLTVNPFTGTDAASWSAAFAGAGAVVVPEMERAALNLAPDVIAVIQSQLAAGKGLVVMGTQNQNASQFLNSINGWSLAYSSDIFSGDIPKSPGVTEFPNSPANLTAQNAVCLLSTTSLPAGAQTVYESGPNTAVFLSGRVAYLGYDWYDGPTTGWDAVLGDALQAVGGGGAGIAPVITSPLTAYAGTGAPFSYQITADNAPTSYNASGLPAGLIVNTSTGEISGSVAAAGVYSITISASNAAGTDNATLELEIIQPIAYIDWPLLGSLPVDRRDPLDRNGPLDMQNLMAFAMGLDPLNSTAADMPAIVDHDPIGGTVTFRYRRAKFIIGTTLIPMASTALGGWNPAVIIDTTIVQDTGHWEIVDVRIPLDPGGRLFIRLAAE